MDHSPLECSHVNIPFVTQFVLEQQGFKYRGLPNDLIMGIATAFIFWNSFDDYMTSVVVLTEKFMIKTFKKEKTGVSCTQCLSQLVTKLTSHRRCDAYQMPKTVAYFVWTRAWTMFWVMVTLNEVRSHVGVLVDPSVDTSLYIQLNC